MISLQIGPTPGDTAEVLNMFKVPAVTTRRSAGLTVFRGATAINDHCAATTAIMAVPLRFMPYKHRSGTGPPVRRGYYCCTLRDFDETFTGDANRGNFLAMLKLTAQMQHIFHHEANIRPT